MWMMVPSKQCSISGVNTQTEVQIGNESIAAQIPRSFSEEQCRPCKSQFCLQDTKQQLTRGVSCQRHIGHAAMTG